MTHEDEFESVKQGARDDHVSGCDPFPCKECVLQEVGVEYAERARDVLLGLRLVSSIGLDETEDRIDPHAYRQIELVLRKLDPLRRTRNTRVPMVSHNRVQHEKLVTQKWAAT